MNLQIPKKAAVINRFAGYGRCSLTEALPILSALRVQACPVPTAVFSNHTGFAAFACQDLTAFLPSYLEQWKQLNLTFDGVLCGFLGQAEQILSVSSFLSDQKSRGCQDVYKRQNSACASCAAVFPPSCRTSFCSRIQFRKTLCSVRKET